MVHVCELECVPDIFIIQSDVAQIQEADNLAQKINSTTITVDAWRTCENACGSTLFRTISSSFCSLNPPVNIVAKYALHTDKIARCA